MQMRSIKRTNHVCPDLKLFRMARNMFVPNSMLLPQFAVFCVLTAPLIDFIPRHTLQPLYSCLSYFIQFQFRTYESYFNPASIFSWIFMSFLINMFQWYCIMARTRLVQSHSKPCHYVFCGQIYWSHITETVKPKLTCHCDLFHVEICVSVPDKKYISWF